MTSLYANLEKGRPYILSVLRIVVALLFLEHGLQKYFGFPSAGSHDDAGRRSLSPRTHQRRSVGT